MFRLNIDKDLMRKARKALDLDSEWFHNLPASVQLAKLEPFIREQTARDERRLGFPLREAA